MTMTRVLREYRALRHLERVVRKHRIGVQEWESDLIEALSRLERIRVNLDKYTRPFKKESQK